MPEAATQPVNLDSADPLIGQRINNLIIVSRLGQGGMGVVYRAHHTTLDRDVAIKFLAAQFTMDSSYIERFLREARAAARLNHGNLIGVYDAGSDNEVYYIAMEFVDGSDLSHLLKDQGSFPETDVIYLGIKAADALSYAHQHGIIHRDIKPENLLLSNEGELKIADLGLAKQINDDNSSMTMSGVIVGTPFYISPEQIRGLKDVDARTDIYSLGVTLFHLATGQVPYKGNSSAEIMSKHLTESTPAPKSINPNLSDGFCQVINGMMAKDPAQRFQTMAEVCLALDGALNGAASALKSPGANPTPSPEAPKRVLRVPILPPVPAPTAEPVEILSVVVPSPVASPVTHALKSVPAPSPVYDFSNLKLKDSAPTLPEPKFFAPAAAFPLGKIAKGAASLVLLAGVIFFFPYLRDVLKPAKAGPLPIPVDTSARRVVAPPKPAETPPPVAAKINPISVETLIRQKIDKILYAMSENISTSSIAKFGMALDSSGAITDLKLLPTNTPPSPETAALLEKKVRAASPFAPSGSGSAAGSDWNGSLTITTKVILTAVKRPLNPSEKTTCAQLKDTIAQATQQIAFLDAEVARLKESLSSASSGSGAGDGSGAGSSFKGDFKGGISQKFKTTPTTGPKSFELNQKIDELNGEMQNLKRRQMQLQAQLEPLEGETITEQVKKPNFAIEVSPTPPLTPTTVSSTASNTAVH